MTDTDTPMTLADFKRAEAILRSKPVVEHTVQYAPAAAEPAPITAAQIVANMTRPEKRAAHRSMRRRGKGWTR